MNEKPSVALIGAGAMGGALLKGWLEAGAIDLARSAVFDPAPGDAVNALCSAHGVSVNTGAAPFDAVVVAVKPQMAGAALPPHRAIIGEALVISVMAGKSVASISSLLGGAAKIVRAMPNLPASIGAGVSGLFASDPVDAEGRRLAETLLRAAGEVLWVRSEADIDIVTAVSGSGPAYFFLLAEALAQAGAALGLDPQAAQTLARATMNGAGALGGVDPRTAVELRRAVTSPGGTTEAALNVLDGDAGALRMLVEKAVAAAAKRAAELTD